MNSLIPKIIDNIVMPLLQILFVVTIFFFILGLIGFFRGGDDADARTTSRNHILWGVIGIFIMVSVYGIVRFVASSVGQTFVLPF